MTTAEHVVSAGMAPFVPHASSTRIRQAAYVMGHRIPRYFINRPHRNGATASAQTRSLHLTRLDFETLLRNTLPVAPAVTPSASRVATRAPFHGPRLCR